MTIIKDRLSKFASIAVIATFLMNMVPVNGVQASSEEDNTKEVIVAYNNQAGLERALQYADEVKTKMKALDAVTVTLHPNEISNLKQNLNIRYVQEGEPVNVLGTPAQWNVEDVNAPDAWAEGYTGENVDVAVVDTGASNHHELQYEQRLSFIEDKEETPSIDESSVMDHKGHGTHVAGIIGAQKGSYNVEGADVVGVSPGADLYSLKVNNQDEGTVIDLIEAINWSISHNMDIVNLSLGTKEDVPMLEDAVDRAYEAGVLVVGASGNNGNGSPVHYPARYDSVIAVSSVDKDGSISPFSSTGESIEFAAPGSNEGGQQVISTIPKSLSEQGYGAMGGTSQAAPHVTGFLALLKQKHPNMTAEQLRNEMQNYVDDLGPAGRDNKYGYGKIDYAAYTEQPPANVTDLQVVETASTSARLSFAKPNDSDVAKFKIFVNETFVGEAVADQGSTINLSGLSADTRYQVVVKSVDEAGNESGGATKTFATTAGSEVDAKDPRMIEAAQEAEDKSIEALNLWDVELLETGEDIISNEARKKLLEYKQQAGIEEIDAGEGKASDLTMHQQKDINFNFNVAMDRDTLIKGKDGNVFVRHDGEFMEDVDIQVSENGKTVTIIPPEEGYESGDYYLYLDDSIKSLQGESLDNPMVVKFSI